MNHEQAFSLKIKNLINAQPKSSLAQLIEQLTENDKKARNYFELLDQFARKLGLEIRATEILNKNGNVSGYIPAFNYLPINAFGHKTGLNVLISHDSTLSINKCYTLLAKELIYKIMLLPDLENQIARR